MAEPIKFFRKSQVLDMTTLSRATMHRKIALGSFPKPEGYLGPRLPIWRQETIYAWMERQISPAEVAAVSGEMKRRAAQGQASVKLEDAAGAPLARRAIDKVGVRQVR
jgi:predicted DNA-binding transcriptional regulator AlpA